jgi:hypothetical protein
MVACRRRFQCVAGEGEFPITGVCCLLTKSVADQNVAGYADRFSTDLSTKTVENTLRQVAHVFKCGDGEERCSRTGAPCLPHGAKASSLVRQALGYDVPRLPTSLSTKSVENQPRDAVPVFICDGGAKRRASRMA